MEDEHLDEILLEEDNDITNERIGFGRRLGAYMLDFLAIIIFGTIVGLMIGDQLSSLFFGQQINEFNQLSNQFGGTDFDFMGLMQKMLGIAAGMSVITVVIFILEAAFGQSVGKFILKIVNTNVDGSRAEAGKLWLRASLKYGATLLSLIGGITGLYFIGTIGSLWSFVIFIGFFFVFGDNKQTIHDMIAKTVVSRK